jgi:AcrR family transcriptional regulator
MARWQSGTAERLQAAALQLFVSKGFRATTAAEIAAAAGLTERTFFRYFSDKRDVLFHGQASYVQLFLDGIENAPAGAPPMDLVGAALDSAASMFTDKRRPFARMRQTVIAENPELRERERHKSAQRALELAGALRRRGVGEPAATLASESGATVFGVAFAQWTAEGEQRALGQIVESVLDELAGLTGRA